MRLKPFAYHRPASFGELFDLMSAQAPGEYILMGGGTDVLLKIRQRLSRPKAVINVTSLPGLSGIESGDGILNIGAGTTLRQVSESPLVRQKFPALAVAAGRAASPQLRSMGTLGGNICLDTRCRYYNQLEWPGAFPPCFKRGGNLCHVVKRGTRCYAAFSADTPPALLALEAILEVAGPRGNRAVPLADFYREDGQDYHCLPKDEVLVRVKLPLDRSQTSSYERFTLRQSIDFPLVGVAVAMEDTGRGAYGNPRIAATGLGSRPVRLLELENLLHGKELGGQNDLAKEIAQGVKGLPMVRHHGISTSYRREILGVMIKRAMAGCLAGEETQVEKSH